jgi:hypothetical protein
LPMLRACSSVCSLMRPLSARCRIPRCAGQKTGRCAVIHVIGVSDDVDQRTVACGGDASDSPLLRRSGAWAALQSVQYAIHLEWR